MMEAGTLKEFKEMLLTKKQEVLISVESLRQRAEDLSGSNSNGSAGYSFHMADQATDTMEREKTFLFISRHEKMLKQINSSLGLIELGEYGICRVCGEPINKERLKTVPTTRICVPCKNGEKTKQKK